VNVIVGSPSHSVATCLSPTTLSRSQLKRCPRGARHAPHTKPWNSIPSPTPHRSAFISISFVFFHPIAYGSSNPAGCQSFFQFTSIAGKRREVAKCLRRLFFNFLNPLSSAACPASGHGTAKRLLAFHFIWSVFSYVLGLGFEVFRFNNNKN
jgi:hypothetical protein